MAPSWRPSTAPAARTRRPPARSTLPLIALLLALCVRATSGTDQAPTPWLATGGEAPLAAQPVRARGSWQLATRFHVGGRQALRGHCGNTPGHGTTRLTHARAPLTPAAAAAV
jgi:hypothetical protein